ncbi:hypothetical protein TWF225_005117 [Orbilia oligospora]|uniref:Uncharacterized protein n=1 Tax=Orbilia oligospora TaxID=2813651 RepID=A0A7C8PXM1_ORBOL|nr:hypothetical protein TWF751_004154 [Orbilia oligospora]KAF3185735.1 hypothetical protein TWF225_005117 [Orbilia oligospora]KAF3241506.1 hypothetical protein TWF128_010994 [Orbilia oligospora]KAF3249337.1 hypothetical protein TWF217_008934 [Orbilia oligospora]KAF3296414.1 hypothetical protein TWF132_011007 [Orbilia oligospora]
MMDMMAATTELLRFEGPCTIFGHDITYELLCIYHNLTLTIPLTKRQKRDNKESFFLETRTGPNSLEKWSRNPHRRGRKLEREKHVAPWKGKLPCGVSEYIACRDLVPYV